MDNDGKFYIGSANGNPISIFGYGNSFYTDSVNMISAPFRIELINTTSPVFVIDNFAVSSGYTSSLGDLIIANVTDTSNYITYRITSQRTSDSPVSYTVIIEQLAP